MRGKFVDGKGGTEKGGGKRYLGEKKEVVSGMWEDGKRGTGKIGS